MMSTSTETTDLALFTYQMNTWNLKQYLNYGLQIVRMNTIVLWWIGLIGLLSALTLMLKDSLSFWPLNVVVTLLSILSTPIIYGMYFELIEDNYSSIPRIARTYVPGYLWLIIRMYLPPIFLASMVISLMVGSIPAFGGGGILEMTLVLFSLLYLFVIPTYYISGTGRGAISGGIFFLSRNLSSATPIILAVLLLETGMLVLQYQRATFNADLGTIFIVLDFLVYFFASIVDYLIFIILIFILKEQPADSDQSGQDQT
ncbi:MAG: hypothetical protein KJO28_09205 [Desulfofustis sp.]|nr:hypothetical protein [Desulfofustis sp.]